MIVIFGISALSYSHPGGHGKVFYIADDADNAPFIWKDNKTGKPVGIHHDIMTEAFKRMKIRLKFEVFTWKRAQDLVKKGEADALISIPTEGRLKYLIASKKPVLTIKNRLFVSVQNKKIEEYKKISKLSDLKKYKLINHIGDGWAKNILEKKEGIKIQWSSSFKSVLRKLANGGGESIFVQDEFLTSYNIKKHGLKNKVTYVPGVDVRSKVFNLLVRKDSENLRILKKYNAVFEKMLEEGTIEKIYSKYR